MTSIEQHDIRVGDRAVYVQRSEGVVREIANGRVMQFEDETFTHTETWELIERPKPEAKLGSVWVDPLTAAPYLVVWHGRYENEMGDVLDPSLPRNRALIARLVPAEEQADNKPSGMAQCAERQDGHHCRLGPDHAGMHNDGRGFRWIAEEQA